MRIIRTEYYYSEEEVRESHLFRSKERNKRARKNPGLAVMWFSNEQLGISDSPVGFWQTKMRGFQVLETFDATHESDLFYGLYPFINASLQGLRPRAYRQLVAGGALVVASAKTTKCYRVFSNLRSPSSSLL